MLTTQDRLNSARDALRVELDKPDSDLDLTKLLETSQEYADALEVWLNELMIKTRQLEEK